MEKVGVDLEWFGNVKEKLNDGRKYLKINYKVYCKEDGSLCVDYCRVFVFSDSSDEVFK